MTTIPRESYEYCGIFNVIIHFAIMNGDFAMIHFTIFVHCDKRTDLAMLIGTVGG